MAAGIDQVTARVTEETGLEIEIAEAAALGIARAAGGELGGEIGGAGDGGGEFGFVGEEKILHQRLAIVFDAAEGAVGMDAGLGMFIEGIVDDFFIAEGAERAVDGADDAVVGFDLVRENEQRDGVAGGGEIIGDIDVGGQGFAVGRRRLDGFGIAAIGAEEKCVAHVRLLAEVSGDVPAAPPLAERAFLRGDEGAGGENGLAVGIGEDRAHEQAGDVAGHGGAVTLQAVIGFAEDFGGGALIDGVERRAEFGVGAGDFDVVAAGDVADVGVIVEVNGARAGWGNAIALKAGFGEDEGLRRWGYF